VVSQKTNGEKINPTQNIRNVIVQSKPVSSLFYIKCILHVIGGKGNHINLIHQPRLVRFLQLILCDVS